MLTNVVYKGDYLANKTICMVPGKQVVNREYRDQIYISEHHEPIIPPEEYDRVQEMVESGALISHRRRKGVQ